MNSSSSCHETSELARREDFLASRKAAGLLIDVETCRIWWEHRDMADPYGVDPDSYGVDPDHGCIGRVTFVGSLESDGPVCDSDLPEDKLRALDARIKRAKHTPTTAEGVRDVLAEEYNLAVAALDDVIYDLVSVTDRGGRFPGVPCDVMRCGVRLALAKLGKESTPLHEALERKLRRFEQERLRDARILYR
jgi:hypothetical protein